MTEATAPHIVEEQLHTPASYLTIRPGDRVYDLYGWAVGQVVEPRIVATRDEFFDGVLVEFRGERLFVDSPEVRAIYDGVVVLELTVADLSRVTSDREAPPLWPGGPCQAPARRPSEAAAPDDAVALMGAVSRMYAADRISLGTLEREVERVLGARTCADLDEIAGRLLPVPESLTDAA